MHKRVNITLPEETLELIDRTAERGDRSRLIDQAVRYFIHEKGRAHLRKLLQEGAERRAKRDLSMAKEWFGLEDELWRYDRR